MLEILGIFKGHSVYVKLSAGYSISSNKECLSKYSFVIPPNLLYAVFAKGLPSVEVKTEITC